jgi:hypothetical protein
MLAVTAVAVAWIAAGPGRGSEGRAEQAVVESAGQSATYTLSDSLIVRVSGPRGTTSIAITAGSARVMSSPCVNQICVLAGSLSRAGDLAACVPNQVLLRLEGSRRSEFDGITR